MSCKSCLSPLELEFLPQATKYSQLWRLVSWEQDDSGISPQQLCRAFDTSCIVAFRDRIAALIDDMVRMT